MLLRAYTVYIRPLVEHDSVISSAFTVKDIEAIESVQRRFTKRLPGLSYFTYHERLKRINIPSLEHRRLYFDLIWCYKILFEHVDLEFDDFFEWALHPGTRGHRFKLYKKSSCIRIRQ